MAGKRVIKANIIHALVSGLGAFIAAQLAGLPLSLSVGIGLFAALGGSANHLVAFKRTSRLIGEINESLHDGGDSKRSS